MDNEKFLNYWQDMYSKENIFGTGPTKLAKLAMEVILKNHLTKILEIGCGQGRDAIFFSQNKIRIDAFDISRNAINFINKTKDEKNLELLKVFVHDATVPLNEPNIGYDFAYSNLALQFFNLNNLKKIFDNISNVLSNESYFLLSTKKKGDKYYKFGNKIDENAYENKGVTRYFFEEEDLKKLLEEKFEIIKFDADKHMNLDSTVSEWWKVLVKKRN